MTKWDNKLWRERDNGKLVEVGLALLMIREPDGIVYTTTVGEVYRRFERTDLDVSDSQGYITNPYTGQIG